MGAESTSLADVVQVARSDPGAAWLLVEAAAVRVARRVGRKFRLDHAACEDIAHDATLTAAKNDFAALRRRDPATPLGAWLTICAHNIARVRLRSERRSRTGALESGDAVAPAEGEDDSLPRSDATADVASLLRELTSTQRRVEEARLAAGSERKAAARLGVSRNRVHDIHRRALRRLKEGAPATRDDSIWAAAADRARRAGEEDLARLLDLLAAGRTRREIAEALRTTQTAIRGRVSRARRRWGASRDS